MTNSSRLAMLAALGLGLAACADNPNVRPPIAGTTMGSAGESAARVATDQIPQSQREESSSGVGTFVGTQGGGERAGAPTIQYQGTPTGNRGGDIPQQYIPPIVRPRGG